MSAAVASGVNSLMTSVVGTGLDVHGGSPAVLKVGAISVDGFNQAYAGGLGHGFVNAVKASYAVYNLSPPPP